MIFNGNKLSYEGERVYWRHGTLRGRRVACHTVGVIDTQRRRLLTDINVCMSRARSVLWVGESDGPDSLDHLPQLPQSYSGLSCYFVCWSSPPSTTDSSQTRQTSSACSFLSLLRKQRRLWPLLSRLFQVRSPDVWRSSALRALYHGPLLHSDYETKS